jgi:hypothetical protein
LLRFKGLGKCVGLGFGPPLKPSFGKTSDDQPPANAVERQDFESRAAAIAKNEKSTVIKLGVELSAAQADQPIDAVTLSLVAGQNSNALSYLTSVIY